METIKQCIRRQQFESLPIHLAETCTLLIAIRENAPELSAGDFETFQNTIVNFRQLEQQSDENAAGNLPPANIATINLAISTDIDSLQVILIKLRKTIGT